MPTRMASTECFPKKCSYMRLLLLVKFLLQHLSDGQRTWDGAKRVPSWCDTALSRHATSRLFVDSLSLSNGLGSTFYPVSYHGGPPDSPHVAYTRAGGFLLSVLATKRLDHASALFGGGAADHLETFFRKPESSTSRRRPFAADPPRVVFQDGPSFLQ